MVRCTPGSSLIVFSTEASVTQPLSNFSVVTSLAVINGMITCTSSLVSGSYVSLSIFLNHCSRLWRGRYQFEHVNHEVASLRFLVLFIGQVHHGAAESPYTAKEKPESAGREAAWAGAAVVRDSGPANANSKEQTFINLRIVVFLIFEQFIVCMFRQNPLDFVRAQRGRISSLRVRSCGNCRLRQA